MEDLSTTLLRLSVYLSDSASSLSWFSSTLLQWAAETLSRTVSLLNWKTATDEKIPCPRCIVR
jgi:hypothetical protein